MGSSSTDADHRAQIRRQEVVADLSRQALETGDLDGVLADAALATAETLDIEYCSVFELRPDRTAAVLRAGAGWSTDRFGSTVVSADRSSWTGYAVRAAEPVVADDLDAESRFSTPELLADRDVASGAVVRIGPAEQPWGVLGAYAAESHAFPEADVDFLERVADVLGSAVEHARTRRDLERTERRFEAIFEDPNILVGLLDPDGTVRGINGTAMEYIDAELEDVTGVPFWETPWWGEGDDVRGDVKRWTERAADGEYVNFEADLTRPDGERYTLNGAFRPVTNDEGEVVSVIVSDRDVTERKARERELEESEQRYRTLVDHFPNGVVALVDENLCYRTVGGNPTDTADATTDELEGEPVVEAVPPSLADELAPRYEAALEGESSAFEATANGRVYDFRIVPVRDDDGEVFAALGMSQDITERKEYERKLEESNERLEQFAYAASHDLQEPLRMVTSYLTLLENRYGDAFDEDGREFLEFAVDGAERMREMIDGLLEYSRVETRGDPFEPMDLDAVVDDVLEDLQFRIEETDAEITVEDLPRVEGDASQLRQVFQNLLSNALTYSGDEPPQIHVGAERREAPRASDRRSAERSSASSRTGKARETTAKPSPGPREDGEAAENGGEEWMISVADEGIGIAPDDQERVFTIFDRLHSRGEYDGTGIGLALCERIIERHGGEIWVDSEPGEGATFSVTLPASREP